MRNYSWHAEVVCELDVLTDAWNLARRRALDRLAEEALQVGADAVVGVHLRRGDHDLGRGTIEYVRDGHGDPAARTPTAAAWPILTDVSVQDYWRLRERRPRAGRAAGRHRRRVRLAAALDPRAPRRGRRPRNQELEEISQAFHAARETVRARICAARSTTLRATGAVGVEFSHSVHREKLALASSLQTADCRGWQRGRFGHPVLGLGPQRRRAARLGDHDARRGNGDPAGADAAGRRA